MVQEKRSTAVLELEAFLPYRLSVLSNTVSTAIAKVYQQRFRLSVPEWRVMAILGRYPGLSAAEVAERTAMDKVAVSRAVARLLSTGRIRRRFNDADRRRSQLSLSEDGQAVYREVVPQALALEGELLEVLDDTERAVFSDMLDRLMRRAVTMHARSPR
ncbi:MAG: MarR family transcriptional regulator [Gammaproteobacteria bacterium]|nr:MarR family transcriptional regulator [Gammaproteobacteria bacterium]